MQRCINGCAFGCVSALIRNCVLSGATVCDADDDKIEGGGAWALNEDALFVVEIAGIGMTTLRPCTTTKFLKEFAAVPWTNKSRSNLNIFSQEKPSKFQRIDKITYQMNDSEAPGNYASWECDVERQASIKSAFVDLNSGYLYPSRKWTAPRLPHPSIHR
uniref:Uncharacterized protein n=1 Tax=Romanomermis culicivorax TaxID=13658 RepID=A0A915JLF0_ROMCU